MATRRRPPAGQLHRQRHPGPRGPRAGPQAARHVHRRHRQRRLPPPALGDRRQLGRRGDQRLRHAHRGHAAQGRQDGHRRRQRPRHPGRRHAEVQEAGARADPHHAARGRQVRARQLHRTRAACTASAARSSTRCRSELIAEVKRDGEALRADVRARQADVASCKTIGTGARHRHDHHLPPRRRRSSATSCSSTPS